ncbi:hypothetical protein UT300007_16650 [Clostridium sp. CTA-7]
MKKDRYFNYYIIELVVVIVIFISAYPMLRVRDLDMNGVRNSLESFKNNETMEEGDIKSLRKLYYINKNQVDDFVSFVPKSNMNANEILVLKVKDEKDIPTIKSGIEERIKKQGESFKNYRPEEYNLIENAILEVEGNNIIFIISKDSSQIKEAIDSNFK